MFLRPAAVAVAALLTVAACGGSDDAGNGDSTSGGTDQVTIGLIPIVDVAPIYLGQEQGFFADRDIELTVELAQGGAAIVPSVMSGNAQFGFSNVVSMMVAASGGLPVRLVGPGVRSTGEQGADFNGVAVPGDSPIRTAADLEGRTVGVNTLNNICSVSINESVRKAGGDPSQLNYVELPPPDMPAALDTGQIEATCMSEPFLSGYLARGGRTVASNYVDVAPEADIAVYFTSAELLESDPDLVERFTEALAESHAYAQEHPDETRAIVTTYTSLTAEQVAGVTLPQFPTEFNRESLERIAELAEEDGLLKEPVDLDQLLPAG
ncbi:ABC transporter substrate-binding protein [Blastococcus sp. CT_GayMR16]|uniref:ABC transporter substrate-binding protein n=1 Tax=Blastococcus sp. CT_GayMR16 TaxID=2559607 RepID=UPI001074486A|nr:ABC transporter substrate-binding protein [Blastococcus sp. CT_GayMR16]TFV83384.1 nitrate ABC transporter substrate-binding protein [Blastococcus sp. CT_GayMR16]